jgi:tetratricopeptide (TPR) repeat protein
LQSFTLAIDSSRDTTIVRPKKTNDQNPFAVFENLLQPSNVPIDPLLLVNRALCYFKLGQFENCISDCNDALLLDDRCVKALYRKGEAYRQISKFIEAKVTLKQCECILKENTDLQNQVSLSVVSHTIEVLELLLQDQKVANLEKESLLKSPQALLLHELLESIRTKPSIEFASRSKATDAVVRLLESHISMRQAFRLMQGFEIALSMPPDDLGDLIRAACQDTEENMRFLCQKVETVLPILASSPSSHALGCLLELQNQYPPLAEQIAKPRALNSKITQLVYKGLQESSEKQRWAFYRFVTLILSKRESINMWNLNIEKCVKFAAVQLETVSLEKLWTECIEFLYLVTVHESKVMETAIIGNSNRLVQGLGYFLLNQTNIPEATTSKVLAVLFNTLVKDDCNRHSILEATRLVPTLITNMSKDCHYRICLRILAKISVMNHKSLIPFCSELEWARCYAAISGELDNDTRSTIGDWLQLWTIKVKLSAENAHHEIGEGALDNLLCILRKCSPDPVTNERIIANAAVALAVLVSLPCQQERTIELGGLELIIDLIRKIHHHSRVAGKNLAICCAKLYQNGSLV